MSTEGGRQAAEGRGQAAQVLRVALITPLVYGVAEAAGANLELWARGFEGLGAEAVVNDDCQQLRNSGADEST